ncbi:glutamate receptor ionotropic, kainate 2-like isoform X2 [Dendronephthya gigantea]|nr:glutamate receptor ionotropic, kainate 2-like isoform X2 [Dendronephthya gigantea]
MAIAEINADTTILNGTTLEGISNTTAPLDVKQSVDSACDQIKQSVVAIIGPARSNAVKAVNYISSGIDIPQITFAATDHSLFEAYQQYPFLLRLSSTGDRQSDVIIAIMEHFKWDKAVMITSTDDYGYTTLQRLRHASFQRTTIDIVKTETFPALDDPSLIDFTSPLLSLRSSQVRLVILCSPGKYAKRLLDVAYHLGMVTQDWVWIVSDAIATEMTLFDPVTEQPEYIMGLLGVEPSSTRTENQRSFETRFLARGGKKPVNVYAYKVYDAVWTVAKALHAMAVSNETLTQPNLTCIQCDQNNITKWTDGKSLLRRMKSVSFAGELSTISFTSEGSLQFEGYDVVNLNHHGFERVGYWDNSNDLTLNVSDISWLGQFAGPPQAMKVSMKNKTFKIVTIQEPPFSIKAAGNATGNEAWDGYCMDLLNELAQRLEFNYVLHGSYDGNFGGKSAETQEWNGMVREITDGKADMAVAAFTISSLRQEVIDFTIPYIDLGLTVIMKKKESEKGLLAFMDPFTNDVWFLLFCSTMYVGLVLTICSKLSPYGFYGQVVQANENMLGEDDMDDLEENKDNMNLDEAAWFSMGSLLGQGTDNQPKAISGKVIAAVWWMTGTIFVATYTANLAAFLTIEKSAINIRSLENLVNQDEIKYGTVVSSQPSQFFERSNIALYQKMWSHMQSESTLVETSTDALERVQEGGYAFIWDSAVLEYIINQKPCNTFILNDLFSPLGYGIGLPLNSPYKDLISREILKLRESGFLDKLKNEWFVHKGTCGNSNVKTPSTMVTVQIKDVIGVYMLVAGGIVLGFIFLIFECLYYSRKLVKHPDSEYSTYMEALKARIKLIWSDMKLRWISTRPRANKL